MRMVPWKTYQFPYIKTNSPQLTTLIPQRLCGWVATWLFGFNLDTIWVHIYAVPTHKANIGYVLSICTYSIVLLFQRTAGKIEHQFTSVEPSKQTLRLKALLLYL